MNSSPETAGSTTRIKAGFLEQMRQEHGFKSDQEHAEHLGVERTTLRRWKAGRPPSPAHAAQIVVVTGKRFDEVLEVVPAPKA